MTIQKNDKGVVFVPNQNGTVFGNSVAVENGDFVNSAGEAVPGKIVVDSSIFRGATSTPVSIGRLPANATITGMRFVAVTSTVSRTIRVGVSSDNDKFGTITASTGAGIKTGSLSATGAGRPETEDQDVVASMNTATANLAGSLQIFYS